MNEQDYRQSMQYIENFYQKQQIQQTSQNQSHEDEDGPNLESTPNIDLNNFQSVSPLRLQFPESSGIKSSILTKDGAPITELDMNPVQSVHLDKSCDEK